ncbi:uracil-DNA glycosylase [Afipia carboxidovorans]|uniref:uracil-DNA glycosylase n=1 Tax=Afipia carboxidovorans TaxID=40137 RepID=UPI0030D08DBB
MMSERPPTPHELLAFYLEAGVDCALAEEPVNRLSETEAEPAPIRATPVRERPAPLPVPRTDVAPAPDVAIESARELAPQAKTLDELRGLLEVFDGCALKMTATRLVFGDGNPQARVMFVGEAPGRDEDLQGIPFIGRSGKLLDLMLASIGLDRTSAYIANVIPWRPPGNREPSPHETQMCLPFIRRQIELVDPDVLVCLGKPSSQAVLELKDGIVKSRGRWFDYNTGTRMIRAMATFHPAYLLRQPIYKRMTWKDLRMIRRALAALPPRESA